MLDEKTKSEILTNIGISGTTKTEEITIIAGNANSPTQGNLSHILNLSSGSARLQTSVIKKFNLILSPPKIVQFSIQSSGSGYIRCCLCRRVISYPCWYYSIKYAVNHFHYFICFDGESSDKPSTKCYRREI